MMRSKVAPADTGDVKEESRVPRLFLGGVGGGGVGGGVLSLRCQGGIHNTREKEDQLLIFQPGNITPYMSRGTEPHGGTEGLWAD